MDQSASQPVLDDLVGRFEDISRRALDGQDCAGFDVQNGTASCQRLWRDGEAECLRVLVEPTVSGTPAEFNLDVAEGIVQVEPVGTDLPAVIVFQAREGCTETIVCFRGTLYISHDDPDVDLRDIALIPTTHVKFVPGAHHRVEVREPSGFFQLVIPAEPEESCNALTHAG